MNILIINPPVKNPISEYPNEEGESYIQTEDFGYFPPLGALYVLSYLEKNTSGHNLFFKDCVAENISHNDLPGIINHIRPDVVGITSFTISLLDIVAVTDIIKNVQPDAHVCLGGHHPIAFPFQAAKLKNVDSIVVGEGEIAFTELINTLEKKGDITKIQGVYTFQSIDTWINRGFEDKRFLGNVTVPPAYIDNIDSLPIPNRSFIKNIRYNSVVGASGNLATIISSRGCPYKCTFCDVPYKKYRNRDVKLVLDEAEECLKLGYEEIHFYDDLFNITDTKIITFCEEIRKRKLKFTWDFRGRVNSVTWESLKNAKKTGCRLISFGVETGSDEGLNILRKKTNVKKVREVFKWCRKLGIKTLADFMIGLPFEKSREDVLRSLDFLIELDPDYAQIAILCLFPNTELFKLAIEKGLIKSGKWEAFSLNPTRDFSIDHWEEFLSLKELVALQKEGYKKFYFRPFFILRNLINTRSFYEFTTKARAFLKLLA